LLPFSERQTCSLDTHRQPTARDGVGGAAHIIGKDTAMLLLASSSDGHAHAVHRPAREHRTRAQIKRLCLEALRRVPGCEQTHSTRIARCDDDDGANWMLLMVHPMPPLSSIPDLEAIIDRLRARYLLIEPGPT